MKNYTWVYLATLALLLLNLGQIQAQTKSTRWTIGLDIGFAVCQGDLPPTVLDLYTN